MPNKLLNKLRSIFSPGSHLSPYLPLLAEDSDRKLQRLIADNAAKPITIETGTTEKRPQRNSLTSLLVSDSSTSFKKLCMNPTENWLMLWYVLVFCGIIFYYAEAGIMIAYGQTAWKAQFASSPMLTFNAFFILVFIGDIYVQLNSGYITKGAIILDRYRVVNRYLHYTLYFDLVLIAVLFSAIVSQVYALNYAKLFVVLKFLRMFEFDELILRKLSTDVAIHTTYVISKQLVTIYLLSHTIGIIFYLIDFALLSNPICSPNQGNSTSQCWLNSATAYTPIIGLPWNLQYFYTLYWGVNTICQISYGDIAPNNPIQTPFALFCMCIGLIVYTYIVNSIVKAIMWANQYRDQFRVDLVTFDTYMGQLKVRKEDQLEVVEFLKERFREESSRNLVLEDLMKSKLPSDMKLELVRNAYNHIVHGLEYFLCKSPAITQILYAIREKKYGQNQKIVSQGSPLDDLCSMYKGEVVLSCEFYYSQYGIATINIPDTFITAYQFFLSQRSSFSVISKKNAAFYFISRDAFESRSTEDIDFKQIYHVLQYDLLIKNRLDRIFYKCYFCGKVHHWYECETIFPNFKDVTLYKNARKRDQDRIRVVNIKHRTWRDYLKLKELNRIVSRNKDKVLSQLQKRIYVLKKRLEMNEERFEADSAYDWPNYLKEGNLTRFKELWNMRLVGRKSKGNLRNTIH